MFIAWLDFWRAFWTRPDPPCSAQPPHQKSCDLDKLDEALTAYLESAREVAGGATKNVEDAERLLASLKAIKERKRRSAEGSLL